MSVQVPDTKIQISGKGQPQQIGDLQFCRRQICFPENRNHQQYQDPQQHQPEERKTKSLQVEKNRTPKEIHHQLGNEEIQPLAAGSGGFREIDSGGTYTHEGIQKDPYHRKNPTGRG